MADEQPKPAPAPSTPKPAAPPPTKPPAAPTAGAAPAAAKPLTPAAPAKPPAPPPPKTVTEDVTAVQAKFAAEHLDDTAPDIPTVLLKDAAQMLEVARFLQTERHFEHLALITSVDFKTHIDVIYNFWSYSRNLPFEVKVRVPPDNPKVPSLTGLWVGADWHERENYDLMGVVFEGHPDLRRILLPPTWKGHPLRKDYEWKKEQYVGLDPVTGEDLVFQEPREGAW